MIKHLFNGLIKKLRLVATVIVAVFLIMSICGVLGLTEEMKGNNILDRIIYFIFALICIGIMYLIIYYWFGKANQCPSCHKVFCLKKIGEEIVKKENVSVLVNTRTRNKNGEVIGSQEQYVPGERITYRVNKVCRKCGKMCYSTYRRDIPRV